MKKVGMPRYCVVPVSAENDEKVAEVPLQHYNQKGASTRINNEGTLAHA
jgi:hypothetical protein